MIVLYLRLLNALSPCTHSHFLPTEDLRRVSTAFSASESTKTKTLPHNKHHLKSIPAHPHGAHAFKILNWTKLTFQVSPRFHRGRHIYTLSRTNERSLNSVVNMPLPPRFADLKREIAESYPDFERRVTDAWAEIVKQLEETSEAIKREGSDYIPQVQFDELHNLPEETVQRIRRVGSVVIGDVVDDADAIAWKKSLDEFVSANPGVQGFPGNNKQFFQLYWTKPQVQARSHSNVLATTVWLNNIYHVKGNEDLEGVDLSVPLSYADRFRIRHPGGDWSSFPPHIDSGSIERWDDPDFRSCFADILQGNWRLHDPYELGSRLKAKRTTYKRSDESTLFRTFQGWLSMSETGPTQGTLKVFPDVGLSNAYIILRPFFRPLVDVKSPEIYDPKNWSFDISTSDFPGIYEGGGGYTGPKPNIYTHPHLRLDETMTSLPKVNPGDMVFWHCDVVHSVEREHTGLEDSAVMYIPAVPLTPQNERYVERQKEAFLEGRSPPDFGGGGRENGFVGVGGVGDISTPAGRRAMGFAPDEEVQTPHSQKSKLLAGKKSVSRISHAFRELFK